MTVRNNAVMQKEACEICSTQVLILLFMKMPAKSFNLSHLARAKVRLLFIL